MNRIILLLLLGTVLTTASAQNLYDEGTSKYKIEKRSIRDLPEDLKTETLLFLKFDSIDVPAKRPKGYDKVQFIQYHNHNEKVPKLNKELRESAAKYPYKYKIISMTDTAKYKSYGAKYLFWMNSFDAFTEGRTYGPSGHFEGGTYVSNGGEGTALGIADLTSNKKYLISWTIGMSRTYMYREMIGMLNNKIRKQFK